MTEPMSPHHLVNAMPHLRSSFLVACRIAGTSHSGGESPGSFRIQSHHLDVFNAPFEVHDERGQGLPTEFADFLRRGTVDAVTFLIRCVYCDFRFPWWALHSTM